MSLSEYELHTKPATARNLTCRIRKIAGLMGLAFLLVLVLSGSGFAQGSIFGTVTNADMSTPATGEIKFVGYLNNTDEEIRIQSSHGAGYDEGNWFDDFQNYQTEAPGRPYAYHFFNTANGEGFLLSGIIPDNSFQQEDIVLAPVDWPEAATGLNANLLPDGSAIVFWQPVEGVTWHIYRRVAPSLGSFFRIDNPSGDRSDPGVASAFFNDTEVESSENYSYVIIGESALGDYSPPSIVVSVDVTKCCQGLVGDVNGTGGDIPTMGDISTLIDHLYISYIPLECYAEADINQSGGANPTAADITIGDVSVLIDYLFITGPSLGLSGCL